MSQSLLHHAFGVREGYEHQKTDYVEGRVEFYLRAKEELLKCPDCGHGSGAAPRTALAEDPNGAHWLEGSGARD